MKEDIEDLVLESEEVECSDDVGWTRDALHKIPLRELTHHNAILAEKIQLANAFT